MLSYWINVLISPRCGHSCSALPHIEILIMLVSLVSVSQSLCTQLPKLQRGHPQEFKE